MSDVGGEFVENCGFEGKILREVSQPCAPCDSRDSRDTITREQLAEIEGQADYALPEGCRNDGGWSTTSGIEPQPWPEPEPQPQSEHLQAIIATQAEAIARLQSEAHDLNMEIGGLQRNLRERQARIRDLETLHAAATQTVVDAGKENDRLRAQADEFRSEIHYLQKELGEAIQGRELFAAANREQADKIGALQAATAELQKLHPDHVVRAISTAEWMDQFARDASVSRLQADRNDLAGKVVTLREQLQQANDKLAQLEALQPMAAACSTAQTMVRDMLGHMRCLLALQHTTDRRSFCTLLESILEVFDEAECDDDDDDASDSSDTSEAGQG